MRYEGQVPSKGSSMVYFLLLLAVPVAFIAFFGLSLTYARFLSLEL